MTKLCAILKKNTSMWLSTLKFTLNFLCIFRNTEVCEDDKDSKHCIFFWNIYVSKEIRQFRQTLFLLILIGLKECIVTSEYIWDPTWLSMCAVSVEINSRDAQKTLTFIYMFLSKTTWNIKKTLIFPNEKKKHKKHN